MTPSFAAPPSFVPHLGDVGDGLDARARAAASTTPASLDQLAQMLVVGGAVDLLREFGTSAALDALAARPASLPDRRSEHLPADDARTRAPTTRSATAAIAAYGGAPMPTPWIEELAAPLAVAAAFNCYGLTEFTSVSHALEPEFARDARRLRRAGRSSRFTTGSWTTTSADALPRASRARSWLAGPTRMQGYLAKPRRRRRGVPRPVAADRRPRCDRRRRLPELHGRIAEVIVRGGEKIHAARSRMR